MTWLQRMSSWLIRKAYGSEARAFFDSSLPIWERGFRRWAQPAQYGELVDRNLSIVYACASRNATEVAQAPLRLYAAKRSKGDSLKVRTKAVDTQRKDYLFSENVLAKYLNSAADIEEVLEHPFLDLMLHVNPFMNGFELLELTELFQELTGNAYWLKVRNNLSVPSELWALPAQWVVIEPDVQKFIKAYRYGPTEPRRVFEPEQVVHYKFPNPRDLWYGMGPLQAALGASDLHAKMGEFEDALLSNNARPDFLVTSDEPVGKDQAVAIRRAMDKEFKGHKKAGRYAILTGGLDIKQLSWSPKELSYLSGRKLMIEEVAMIFGVPLSKLKTEDVNRANAEAGDYTYAKNTVLPRLRRMEQKINEGVVADYDDRLFCAYDNPVPEDKDFRLRERQTNLATGYMSINEERQVDNKEPAPWGEVPILPFNLAPLGSAKPQFALGEEDWKAKHVHKLAADDVPDNFESMLKRIFKSQRTEAVKAFEANPKASEHLIDDKWNQELAEKVYPYLKTQIDRGGEVGIGRVRERGKAMRKANELLPIVFDITNPKVQEFLQQYLFKFSFAVNRKTNTLLANTIKQGIEQGETIRQLTGRVQEVFDFAETYRAERIARTEAARAYSAGTEAGYAQTGLVEAKEWVVSPGACEFCMEMQGKTVSLGSNYFSQGQTAEGEAGGEMDLEYSDIEFPPLHPNCVCDIAPVLIEVQ